MSEQLEGAAVEVADMLLERGVVKFAGVAGEPAEGFRLKLHEKNPEARLSPIYLNIRAEGYKDGTLRSEDFRLIADLLCGIANDVWPDFRFIAGIPEAGEPIADAMMARLAPDRPDLVQLHLVKEEDKGGRRITGIREDLWATGQILIVDDLITKADTKLEAITVCEAAGLEVTGVQVLVDREQGGSNELLDKGYDLNAGLTLSELLDYYVETGSIEQSMADDVEDYIKSTSA